jgi:hypothetical protein
MDLLLDYGDISIDKIEYDNQDIDYYDLSIETTDQFITKLLRRTLETPLGYIKKAIVETNIKWLDKDYGNPLYSKLSEPLTLSFIVEAQTDINRCLNSIKGVPGLVFNSVNIVNYNLDSLDIEVNYIYNQQTTNSLLSLPL